jgi:hypothetical protein
MILQGRWPGQFKMDVSDRRVEKSMTTAVFVHTRLVRASSDWVGVRLVMMPAATYANVRTPKRQTGVAAVDSRIN